MRESERIDEALPAAIAALVARLGPALRGAAGAVRGTGKTAATATAGSGGRARLMAHLKTKGKKMALDKVKTKAMDKLVGKGKNDEDAAQALKDQQKREREKLEREQEKIKRQQAASSNSTVEEPTDYTDVSDHSIYKTIGSIIGEACWKGYEKKGMKTMFGKRYPNCVKKKRKLRETMEQLSEEGLRAWFGNSKSKGGKPGWVQVVSGKPCARQPGQKSTPKCVSSSKRASMTPAQRKSAQRRKRKADPNQRFKSGAAKPTYVPTDKPKRKKR